MVNAENQKLDGSFFGGKYKTAREMDAATVKRVIEGKKPFGAITFFAEREKEARALVRRLKKIPHIVVSPIRIRKEGDYLDFQLAQKGRLSDHFDMEALAAWYARNGAPYLAEDILENQHNKLSDYFWQWDWPEAEPWETGLILGYPVENTMRRRYGMEKVVK